MYTISAALAQCNSLSANGFSTPHLSWRPPPGYAHGYFLMVFSPTLMPLFTARNYLRVCCKPYCVVKLSMHSLIVSFLTSRSLFGGVPGPALLFRMQHKL